MLRYEDKKAVEEALETGHMGKLVRMEEVLECIFETPEALTTGGFRMIKDELETMQENITYIENKITKEDKEPLW